VSPIKRYWRSTSQFEVDALIGEDVAVAIKSSDKLSEKHLRGLRALKEEGIFKRYILVCRERQKRTTEDGIEILPWQQFTRLLWDGKLLWWQSGHRIEWELAGTDYTGRVQKSWVFPKADGSDLMGNELAEVKLSGDALAPAGRVQMFGQIH